MIGWRGDYERRSAKAGYEHGHVNCLRLIRERERGHLGRCYIQAGELTRALPSLYSTERPQMARLRQQHVESTYLFDLPAQYK